MNWHNLHIITGLDKNFLAKIITAKKILLVLDENVAKIYLVQLEKLFDKYTLNIVFLASGENNKTWQQVTKIIDSLLENQHDRFSTLVSFGGGITGDLAGFAASIFMRGINFVQIPTTLLAQIDAAIGGKNGCNYLGVKNLIGTFYQPQSIIIDIALLETLPQREYISGLVEVVKYGMACDVSFFVWLEKNMISLINRDVGALKVAVRWCCKIKMDLVQKDEKDHGVRRSLNFGHTFAHAIEAATDYNYYLHGEAVAIGMLLATRLAVKLDFIGEAEFTRLKTMLRGLMLPLNWANEYCNPSLIYNFMLADKKKCAQQLHIILPCAVGEVRVLQGLSLKCLEELIVDYAG